MSAQDSLIAIVLGTRPEIIKCSPVIDECEKRHLRYIVVHTGQHYSAELDAVFFRDLALRSPAYNLGVGSMEAGVMIGTLVTKLSDVFIREKPQIVLVQGDTNSVLAGALAANKCGALVGHIEAGLRSFDRSMPEEINRIATDALSDFLFVPTDNARKQLVKEGFGAERVFMVGNTVVDALQRNLEVAKERSLILHRCGVVPDSYAVLTLHRPSNVDNEARLTQLMCALASIPRELIPQILFPVHPRTRERLESSGIVIPSSVKIIDALGYLDFLALLASSRIILTDSGGIQEEACVLRVPCVTLRDNTERPETVAVGANVLSSPDTLDRAIRRMVKHRRSWKNPFGDGQAAARILDIVMSRI